MEIKDQKYNLWSLITIPFCIVPVGTVIRVIETLAKAFLPSALILTTSLFIDTSIGIFNGDTEPGEIIVPLLLLAATVVYQNLADSVMAFVVAKMKSRLSETLRTAMLEKRAKLEYRHIENNDTWDLINRVGRNLDENIANGFDTLLRMIELIASLVFILLILLVQVWWAVPAILAFSGPLIYISVKSGKATYEISKSAAKCRRYSDYLQETLVRREYISERALFGYTGMINRKWSREFDTARKINSKAEKKRYVQLKGASLITLMVALLIIGILIFPLYNGQMSIGMFVGFVNITLGLVNMIGWTFSWLSSELAKSRAYLNDLSEFSTLSEKSDALNAPERPNFLPKCIEFRNVSFCYPGTNVYVLKEFNMTLHSPKHYALVGANGAGKSTVIKLLTGLYDTFEGEILIDGKSIREFTAAELKGLFSVTYQHFARYAVTLKENVSLGNPFDITEEDIQNASLHFGLDEVIHQLPQGYDTPLGRIQQNSVDISGGEWQRVALTRNFVSKAPVCILDEPTASLDPIAESNIYSMFDQISQGKLTVFITHRLGAAKLADEIIVLDDGKVVEQGDHTTLIEQNGNYCKMYTAQRSWYQ